MLIVRLSIVSIKFMDLLSWNHRIAYEFKHFKSEHRKNRWTFLMTRSGLKYSRSDFSYASPNDQPSLSVLRLGTSRSLVTYILILAIPILFCIFNHLEMRFNLHISALMQHMNTMYHAFFFGPLCRIVCGICRLVIWNFDLNLFELDANIKIILQFHF